MRTLGEVLQLAVRDFELVSAFPYRESKVDQKQEALTKLLVEKGIFTKEELLGMVRVVRRETKKEEL
jgi:uncharacterized protein YqgQ